MLWHFILECIISLQTVSVSGFVHTWSIDSGLKEIILEGASWVIILESTSSSSLWKIICSTNNVFPCLSTHSQNADKLYQGHLSEFTPLASLHALSKPGNQRRGSAHQRNAAHSHRSQGFEKKTMLTRWQRTPDYCTFSPLLTFSDGPRCSKLGYPNNGAGPKTAVWFIFLWYSLLFSIRYRVKHYCITNVTKTCLCYWDGTFVIHFIRDYN